MNMQELWKILCWAKTPKNRWSWTKNETYPLSFRRQQQFVWRFAASTDGDNYRFPLWVCPGMIVTFSALAAFLRFFVNLVAIQNPYFYFVGVFVVAAAVTAASIPTHIQPHLAFATLPASNSFFILFSAFCIKRGICISCINFCRLSLGSQWYLLLRMDILSFRFYFWLSFDFHVSTHLRSSGNRSVRVCWWCLFAASTFRYGILSFSASVFVCFCLSSGWYQLSRVYFLLFSFIKFINGICLCLFDTFRLYHLLLSFFFPLFFSCSPRLLMLSFLRKHIHTEREREIHTLIESIFFRVYVARILAGMMVFFVFYIFYLSLAKLINFVNQRIFDGVIRWEYKGRANTSK